MLDERKRQKALEDLGYHFIRINPDKQFFNDQEEFGRVQKYITESTKKLMVDEISKIMLEMKFEQNLEIKPKTLKYIANKKLSLHKKMKQTKYVKKKINYCLKCGRKTKNENIKGVTLKSEIGQQKSTCVACDSRKSTF